jgi:hypothetical protein
VALLLVVRDHLVKLDTTLDKLDHRTNHEDDAQTAEPRYHLACPAPDGRACRDQDLSFRAVTGLPVRFYWVHDCVISTSSITEDCSSGGSPLMTAQAPVHTAYGGA